MCLFELEKYEICIDDCGYRVSTTLADISLSILLGWVVIQRSALTDSKAVQVDTAGAMFHNVLQVLMEKQHHLSLLLTQAAFGKPMFTFEDCDSDYNSAR